MTLNMVTFMKQKHQKYKSLHEHETAWTDSVTESKEDWKGEDIQHKEEDKNCYDSIAVKEDGKRVKLTCKAK
jgi:hypothetical protein